MELNIKDTENFGSGAYVLNPKRSRIMHIKNCNSIFLTRENNTSLRNEILKLIVESTDVLKICSFIITDKDIFEVILEKAKTSNVAIFILTQLDENKLKNSSSLFDFLTEEEIKENPSKTHLMYIKKLFDYGVHVRASISAHAKFIIADRKKGFITSANLTTPSLTFNTESGVYLNENDTQELDKLFDVIFQKGTRFRQFLSISKKNKMLVVQTDTSIEKRYLPDPSKSNLRYTFEDETNNLYDEIVKIINDASTYLYISTYSIVGLRYLPEFIQAIKEAKKRGILINIFCRGMNHRNDHLTDSSTLHAEGCKIFADMFNHSKGIINEKTGLIFTANIDGNHGLKNGFEVGYILNEIQRLEFLEIHKYLIDTGFYIFNNKPTRLELFQTYTSYENSKEIKPPIFSNDIAISIQRGLKVNEKELSEQPLFYGKSQDCEFIIAGNSFYKCKLKDNTFHILEKENPRFDIEKYILKYLNLKIIFN